MSSVELYEEAGGRWRWAYRERAEGKALPSNADYASPVEARAAAGAAYPGVPITQSASAAAPRGPRGRAGKLAGWLAPVVVLVAWSRSRRPR